MENQAHQAQQTQRALSRISDDTHNNSYGSNNSSHRESVVQEKCNEHAPVPPYGQALREPSLKEEVLTHVPAPPPNPPPSHAHTRNMLRRTMTPLPGKVKVMFPYNLMYLWSYILMLKQIKTR